jgi:hypothetical protein
VDAVVLDQVPKPGLRHLSDLLPRMEGSGRPTRARRSGIQGASSAPDPSATPTRVVERLLTLAAFEPTVACRRDAERLCDQGLGVFGR